MLRLMADYDCHPLWDADGRNLDPFSLAIPHGLALALTDWASEYTATLDHSDPPASGFKDVPTKPRSTDESGRVSVP